MDYEYDPKKSLLMGIVELKDVPGALAGASTVVAKMGINVRIASAYSLSNGKGIWTFMGVARTKTDTKKIEKALCASAMVLDCHMKRSDRGFITDTFRFPIRTSSEQRAILLNPKTITSMFSHVKRLFGTGGDVVLFEEGQAVGREVAMAFQQRLGEGRLRELDSEIVGTYMAYGWGILEILERQPDHSSVVISIKDNFEAAGVKATSPNCQFTRGNLAGFHSVIAGRSLSCNETKCAAAGDPACEFVLT